MQACAPYGVTFPDGSFGFAYPTAIGLSGRGIEKPAEIEGLTPNGVWQWMHIAPFGTWMGHPKGEITFSREAFDNIIRLFNRRVNPLKVDYEHDTMNKSIPGHERIAAGYIHRLEIRNEGGEPDSGLWGLVEFTQRAAAKIVAGEIAYNSPVIVPHSTDRKTGSDVGLELIQAAITSDPFLDGQARITLSRSAEEIHMADETKTAPEAKTMAEEMAADVQGIVSKLAAATGYDDAAVIAALMDNLESVAKVIKADSAEEGGGAEGVEAASRETADESALSPVAASRMEKLLESRVQALTREVADLRARNTREDTQRIADRVDRLIRDKKIHAGQRDDAIWAFTHDPKRAERLFSTTLAFTEDQMKPESPASDDNRTGSIALTATESAQFDSYKRAGYSDEKAMAFIAENRSN